MFERLMSDFYRPQTSLPVVEHDQPVYQVYQVYQVIQVILAVLSGQVGHLQMCS